MLMRTDGRVYRRKSLRVANNAPFKSKRTSPPRPIVVGNHFHYEVEAVLGTRGTRAGHVEYNVTWKGYPASANSWIRQLPTFFQTPRKHVLDDDSSSGSGSSASDDSSSGSGSSASDDSSSGSGGSASDEESVNKYVFGNDSDEGSDDEALAPSYCPGAPSYFPGPTHDLRGERTGKGGPSHNSVAQLLEQYQSEYDEYTFHTAYVFLHKQHRLAHRMFTFQTLREHANILASYANEDDEPTPECQRWNLWVDNGDPRLFSDGLDDDSD